MHNATQRNIMKGKTRSNTYPILFAHATCQRVDSSCRPANTFAKSSENQHFAFVPCSRSCCSFPEEQDISVRPLQDQVQTAVSAVGGETNHHSLQEGPKMSRLRLKLPLQPDPSRRRYCCPKDGCCDFPSWLVGADSTF